MLTLQFYYGISIFAKVYSVDSVIKTFAGQTTWTLLPLIKIFQKGPFVSFN